MHPCLDLRIRHSRLTRNAAVPISRVLPFKIEIGDSSVGRVSAIKTVGAAMKSIGRVRGQRFVHKPMLSNPHVRTLREIRRMPGMTQLRRTPQGPGAWPFRQEMDSFIPSSGPRDIVGLAIRPLARRVQHDVDLTRGILSRRTKYPPGLRGRKIPSSHKGIEL